MDNKEHTAEQPVVNAVTLGRGGYRDENDYAESRKRSEIVRGEFLSTTFKAKITFAYDSVTFNMMCVRMFPDNQYISLSVDQPNLRVVAELCEGGETISLKFANKKDGRNIPRKCMARNLCEMLYDMMGWNTQAKYRSLAIEQTFFGKKIIVFNLDECLQVFTETFTAEDGKAKRKTTVNMPGDWKGRFGYTPEELAYKQRKVEKSAQFIRIDNKTGEQRSGLIEPKLPTPEELMHQPYGGLRQRKEEDIDDE